LGEVFSFIAAEKTNYPVAVMCCVFAVSGTGFHNWERRAPSERALQDAWLSERIKRIHDASGGVLGRPGSTPSCGWRTASAWGESGSRG
jgi:putative transposase